MHARDASQTWLHDSSSPIVSFASYLFCFSVASLYLVLHLSLCENLIFLFSHFCPLSFLRGPTRLCWMHGSLRDAAGRSTAL